MIEAHAAHFPLYQVEVVRLVCPGHPQLVVTDLPPTHMVIRTPPLVWIALVLEVLTVRPEITT